ncbi:hypothetical protein CLOM621_07785 [Clostridium sp. M62/1]|nr:hypothetical protein CLOM621_07785 [Clostridium sp. M62/1]
MCAGRRILFLISPSFQMVSYEFLTLLCTGLYFRMVHGIF